MNPISMEKWPSHCLFLMVLVTHTWPWGDLSAPYYSWCPMTWPFPAPRHCPVPLPAQAPAQVPPHGAASCPGQCLPRSPTPACQCLPISVKPFPAPPPRVCPLDPQLHHLPLHLASDRCTWPETGSHVSGAMWCHLRVLWGGGGRWGLGPIDATWTDTVKGKHRI